MNSRNTWRWLLVALVLFAIIYFVPRPGNRRPSLTPVLPHLRTSDVSVIQVLPHGHQLEIRASRTNGSWQLTKPIAYPAASTNVNLLLQVFEHLAPAARITEEELTTNRFNADEEFGFSDPQVTLIFQQSETFSRIRIGKLTPPGDQVFLQVVGVEGIYIVDAEVLRLIPKTADEWRDTAFFGLAPQAFDRIAVTNGAKIFVLQRDGANVPWRMSFPIQARADNPRVTEALEQLRSIRISRFVADDAKSDLDALGLQAPELELSVSQGTNTLAWLQFGKSPTNDPAQVFARLSGRNATVTVPKAPLAAWRVTSYNDFRDPHLLNLSGLIESIRVCAEDSFALQRQPDSNWQVMPQNFPADAGVVRDFITELAELKIVDFVKDVVPDKALPDYGLASPVRQYSIKFADDDTAASTTNESVIDVTFGQAQDRIYARRADEPSVYGVSPEDLQRLPSASRQFRERRLWHFSLEDVARVTIHQEGRERQIVRNGPYEWSLAGHSHGSIEPLAIEETLRGLVQLSAGDWIGAGAAELARCGFDNPSLEIAFDLKNGGKAAIEFAGQNSFGLPFATVTMDGQRWVFELPLSQTAASLWRDMKACLSVPRAN